MVKINDKIKTKYGVLTVKEVRGSRLFLVDTLEGFIIPVWNLNELVIVTNEKEYVAVCKYEGKIEVIRNKAKTKKEFKAYLNDNGYTIIYSYVFTPEEFDKYTNEDTEFMKWFEERLYKRKQQSRLSNIKRKYNNII